MLTAPSVLGTVRENGSSYLDSAAEFIGGMTAFGDDELEREDTNGQT